MDFGTGGSVSGNVTAATLDYTSYTSALTLNVTANTITPNGVGGTLSGVTQVNANAANSNTVTASSGTTTYTLDNATANKGSGGATGGRTSRPSMMRRGR